MKYAIKIFGLCFLLSGLFILFHSLESWSEKRRIISNGGHVIGEVVSKDEVYLEGSFVYKYTFEYYIKGKRYLINNELFTDDENTYFVGDNYKIYYDKANPNNALIISQNETVNIKLVEILLFSTFIIVGLLILLINHKKVEQIFKNN